MPPSSASLLLLHPKGSFARKRAVTPSGAAHSECIGIFAHRRCGGLSSKPKHTHSTPDRVKRGQYTGAGRSPARRRPPVRSYQ